MGRLRTRHSHQSGERPEEPPNPAHTRICGEVALWTCSSQDWIHCLSIWLFILYSETVIQDTPLPQQRRTQTTLLQTGTPILSPKVRV